MAEPTLLAPRTRGWVAAGDDSLAGETEKELVTGKQLPGECVIGLVALGLQLFFADFWVISPTIGRDGALAWYICCVDVFLAEGKVGPQRGQEQAWYSLIQKYFIRRTVQAQQFLDNPLFRYLIDRKSRETEVGRAASGYEQRNRRWSSLSAADAEQARKQSTRPCCGQKNTSFV